MKHEKINQPIENFNLINNEIGWETTQIGCAFKNSEIKVSAMLSVSIHDDGTHILDFFEPQKDWYCLQKTDKELETLENRIKLFKAEESKSGISYREKIDELTKSLSYYKKFQKRKEYTAEEFNQHFYISYLYQLKKGENGTSRTIFFKNS